MSEAFNKAFTYLLQDEGTKYTNDPKDSGGPTKFGITQKTYEQHFARLSTTDEIRNMSVDTAKDIYFNLYWNPNRCGDFRHLGLAIAVFNSAVLYGVHTAAIMAQLALNKCGFPLKSDGVFGDKSIAAINSVEPKKFLEAFRGQLLSRIETVISKDPKNERFRNGWTNRADKLIALADEIADTTKIV